MSKKLATIITDVPVEYDFTEAALASNDALYTPEAYLMCKKLEFKNLLGRFSVDAPKNNAQEHFTVIKTKAETERIWKKVDEKPLAFTVIPNADHKQESDGQMLLFAAAPKNAFAALAVAFSEEDIYLFVTGDELTAADLMTHLFACKSGQLLTADLKSQLPYLEWMNEEKAAEVQKKIESRDDELGVMAQSMGSLISELRGLMQKIHELTKYLATSAQQLTASAQQSAEASDSVAQSITNVAASCSNQGDVVNSAGDQTNIFSNDMSGFSDRLSASSEQINETTLAADEGRKQVNEAVEKIKVIEESVENTSKAVSQLGEQIGDIDDIVTDIQDIARQTNLLSLNASIEAARAGEAGKGFAVVASEIQTLAQQSSDSAGHIAEKISAIQSQSDIALNAMQSGLENVKGGASAVEGAGKAFEGIADMIEKVNVNAQEMQRVVESLTSGTESIKDAFSNIKSQSDSVIGETENVSAASEEQSASMQEIAEASKKLSEVAEQLEKAVAKFRL